MTLIRTLDCVSKGTIFRLVSGRFDGYFVKCATLHTMYGKYTCHSIHTGESFHFEGNENIVPAKVTIKDYEEGE